MNMWVVTWFWLVSVSIRRYLVDIVYKQFLGFSNAGNKVLDLGQIRRRYWTSWWALVDVASALPLDIGAALLGVHSWVYRIPKLLRYAYVIAVVFALSLPLVSVMCRAGDGGGAARVGRGGGVRMLSNSRNLIRVGVVTAISQRIWIGGSNRLL